MKFINLIPVCGQLGYRKYDTQLFQKYGSELTPAITEILKDLTIKEIIQNTIKINKIFQNDPEFAQRCSVMQKEEATAFLNDFEQWLQWLEHEPETFLSHYCIVAVIRVCVSTVSSKKVDDYKLQFIQNIYSLGFDEKL